ncbi:MAG TPA: serine/threonine-protein phosphatase [Planctomycetota bacterium]|nr:serine/threonine-protein phosphatase [Planctomycetota bacterium]HRV80888.1 serine/threonine-protein phosphatase [Planctomycetota bacterium]
MGSKDFHTWLGADEPGVALFECAAGNVAVVSRAKNIPGRVNEDALGFFPMGGDGAVLVVADGMGGGAHGEVAAETVIRAIETQLAPLPDQPSLSAVRVAILTAVEEANRSVLDMGVGAGTTIAAALVSPRRYATIHAGDSVVMVVGQKGRVKAQTLAHSPVGFAMEAGLLDPDKAMFHHERHLVSNVVGMVGMRLEIGSPRKFSLRDTLILASDGLFDNLTVSEVVEHIRCGPLEEAARTVAELAKQRMDTPLAAEPSKPDDLGMILFRPHRPQ